MEKIVAYGNLVLRKKTKNLIKEDFDNGTISKLIEELKETLNSTTGIGLAAPQINKSFSIFIVVNLKNYIKEEKKEFKVFINPEIIEYSKECMSSREGCLSIPDVEIHIYRPTVIKVKYLNEEFEIVEEQISGLSACVFQHEFDHLNGKLIIDYVKKGDFKKIQKKLEDIETGKIKVKYEMIFKINKNEHEKTNL